MGDISRLTEELEDIVPRWALLGIDKVLSAQHHALWNPITTDECYAYSDVVVSGDSKVPPYVFTMRPEVRINYEKTGNPDVLERSLLSRVSPMMVWQHMELLREKIAYVPSLYSEIRSVYHQGWKRAERVVLDGSPNPIYLIKGNDSIDIAKDWENLLQDRGAVKILDDLSARAFENFELINLAKPKEPERKANPWNVRLGEAVRYVLNPQSKSLG